MPNRSRATRSCTRGSSSMADRGLGQRVHQPLEPADLGLLLRLLPAELQQIQRAVFPSLQREVQRTRPGR